MTQMEGVFGEVTSWNGRLYANAPTNERELSRGNTPPRGVRPLGAIPGPLGAIGP